MVLELHRSRFVEWQPAAVVALAVAPGGLTVALARETGDLEIYDTADWRCTARVPGREGAAVSSLTWCAPFALADDADGGSGGGAESAACRLLSAGLDGQITEWDLNTLRPCGATDSHGGSVWAMSSEPSPRRGAPQRVAVACDDGCVRLLTLVAGDGVGSGLAHRRSFNRVAGRLLSLAWTADGSTIAAGSSRGAIHVFDCDSLTELARITVGAGDKPTESEERCVWALQYLPDGTLVSGSSDGDVTFWDAQHGTQLSSHRQHRADVLALAASPDGNVVFASGVDAQVAAFERVPPDERGLDRWTFTGTKRPHTHDVRALAMAAAPPSAGGGGGSGHAGGAILLSGGNDAQLLAYPAARFRKRHPVRVVSVPQSTPLAMTGGGTWSVPAKTPSKGKKKGAEAGAGRAPQPRAGTPSPPLLLCDHARWLDVWRLGEGIGGGPGGPAADALATVKGHNGMMKLSAAPKHVLRAKLGGNRRTLCSAISPDGKFIAVSDTHSLRLFEMTPGGDDEEWTLRKQESPAGGVTCAHLLLFTPDGKVLVAVGASGAVNVIDLESWEVMEVLKQHLPKASASAAALERAAVKSGAKRKTSDAADADADGGVDGALPADAVLSADVGCPAVSHACASADGQWLAVVTAPAGRFGRRAAGVHVYNLDALKLHASLAPPPGHAAWPPVAAMALSAGGLLALATRDNAVLSYDVESARLSPWSEALAAAETATPAELAAMPGQICGLSFDPTPGSSALLAHTPSAIARINLAATPAIGNAEPGPAAKRRRGKGGAEAGEERKHRGGDTNDIKVVTLDDPCLFLGYFAPGQALMVERPWKDVLKSIPEPLYRHRFGT